MHTITAQMHSNQLHHISSLPTHHPLIKVSNFLLVVAFHPWLCSAFHLCTAAVHIITAQMHNYQLDHISISPSAAQHSPTLLLLLLLQKSLCSCSSPIVYNNDNPEIHHMEQNECEGEVGAFKQHSRAPACIFIVMCDIAKYSLSSSAARHCSCC